METSNDSWTIKKKWPKRLFWVSIFIPLIYIFFFLDSHPTLDRHRVTELSAFTEQAKDEIEPLLSANPKQKINLDANTLIPATIGVKTKEGETIEIAFREITETGEIRVYTPQLGVLLVLKPSVVEGKVKWTCWGWPQKIMSVECREDQR